MAVYDPNAVLGDVIATLEDAHVRLVGLVAAQASRGATSAPATADVASAWLSARLADTEVLRAQATKVISGGTVSQATVDAFLADAWGIGTDYADAELEAAARALAGTATATLDARLTAPAQRSPRQLVALAREAHASLAVTQMPMLRSTMDAYRTCVYDAARLMTTGTMTLRQAVALASDRMASRGVGAFVDGAGRSWRPETYAEMALRTAYQRSGNQARLDRYTERGHNLVIVSDAPRECPLCRPWEGKVLAIDPSGDTSGVTVAGSVAAAQAAGLQHPRCRHQLNLYVPGLSNTPPTNTADPDGYARDQAHKAARNRVRVAQRRLVAAQAVGEQSVIDRAQVRLTAARRAARNYTQDPLFPAAVSR